jgi:hypothetical protein
LSEKGGKDMGKFFDFLVRWGEKIYETRSEWIKQVYHIEEIYLENTDNVKTAAPVQPVSSAKTVTKLNTIEVHNS